MVLGNMPVVNKGFGKSFNSVLSQKIRKRIRISHKTGQRQPRVRLLGRRLFGYVVKHHQPMLVFEMTKRGRLVRCEDREYLKK